MKRILPSLFWASALWGIVGAAVHGEDGGRAQWEGGEITPQRLSGIIEGLRNSARAFDIEAECHAIFNASRYSENELNEDIFKTHSEMTGTYVWKKRLDAGYLEAYETFADPQRPPREYRWFTTPDFARHCAHDSAMSDHSGKPVKHMRGQVTPGDQGYRTANHYLEMVWPEIETIFIGRFDNAILEEAGSLVIAKHYSVNEATGFVMEDRAVFDRERGFAPLEYFWSRRMLDPAKGPDKRAWRKYGPSRQRSAEIHLPDWILIYDGDFDTLTRYTLTKYADGENVAAGSIDFAFPEGAIVFDQMANVVYKAGPPPPAAPDPILVLPPEPAMPAIPEEMPARALPPREADEADRP